MQAVFAEVPVRLLDATERPDPPGSRPPGTGRPTTRAKKRTTRQNALPADPARYIHYLGPTTSATTPDYQPFKNELDGNLGLLDWWRVLADLG